MLRKTLPLLAAFLAIAAPVGAGQPVVTVTTFAISGHGWGHGVGMAQWGAYGYALHSKPFDWILAHYYPVTTLAPAQVANIRVLLAEGVTSLTVSSDSDFTVRGADGAVHPLAAGAYPIDAKLQLRSLQSLQAPLTFLPGASPLRLDHPYRGSIEVSVAGGHLQAVNVLGLDAYVRGVVSEEMPSDWPLEAVKVQAVAARSYALSSRRTGSSFDVYADGRDQVYGGLDAESTVGNEAVKETAKQVLYYGGKVATTFFSASSGGRTAAITDVFTPNSPMPYLVSVADPWDKLSPHHNWGPVILSGAQISGELGVIGVIDLIPTPANGHARTVTVVGTAGPVTMKGPDIRRALNLRSTWFTAGVLSLSRAQGTVVAGTAVTLNGVVRRLANATLEQRVVGGDWQPGPAIAPAADGSFSVVVTPTATSEYRLVASPVVSRALRVPVS